MYNLNAVYAWKKKGKNIVSSIITKPVNSQRKKRICYCTDASLLRLRSRAQRSTHPQFHFFRTQTSHADFTALIKKLKSLSFTENKLRKKFLGDIPKLKNNQKYIYIGMTTPSRFSARSHGLLPKETGKTCSQNLSLSLTTLTGFWLVASLLRGDGIVEQTLTNCLLCTIR